MKKIKVVLVAIIISILIIPTSTYAVTLKEYEDMVAKYTAELEEKQSKMAKNEQEVKEIKAKIANIEQQIAEAEEQIDQLKVEIDESNQEIKNKEKESKSLVQYFQVISNENTYLEYIFEADSITDMIYRVSVVEQLTDYNEQVMDDLEKLIETNKQKTKELDEKNDELADLTKELNSEKERIETENREIEGTIPSTKGQIEYYKKQVSYYKSRGCKSNDVIGVTCDKPPVSTSGGGSSNAGSGAIIGANGFRRPIVGGRISWYYGNGGHKGMDYAAGCGTPIYPVAAGRVYYVGNTLDAWGAKMILIVHNVNGRLVFSQYAHLQGYNVSVGQNVDIGDVIGYVGSTGNSSGCHLHLEMAEDYGWVYNGTYSQYTSHIINPLKYVPN